MLQTIFKGRNRNYLRKLLFHKAKKLILFQIFAGPFCELSEATPWLNNLYDSQLNAMVMVRTTNYKSELIE